MLFDEVDSDGSGFITVNEVKDLIRKSGHGGDVSDSEIEALVKACDDNGDGKISFEEFVTNMVGQMIYKVTCEIKSNFNVISMHAVPQAVKTYRLLLVQHTTDFAIWIFKLPDTPSRALLLLHE